MIKITPKTSKITKLPLEISLLIKKTLKTFKMVELLLGTSKMTKISIHLQNVQNIQTTKMTRIYLKPPNDQYSMIEFQSFWKFSRYFGHFILQKKIKIFILHLFKDLKIFFVNIFKKCNQTLKGKMFSTENIFHRKTINMKQTYRKKRFYFKRLYIRK